MKFRSGFEKRVYEHAVDRGQQLDYERKDTALSYHRLSNYLPDFVLPNGILIECKGHFQPKDRTKALLVRKQNPQADIRFVFQRANNRLTKSPNSKTYWQWCEKHDFGWAEGKIPEEWFNE